MRGGGGLQERPPSFQTRPERYQKTNKGEEREGQKENGKHQDQNRGGGKGRPPKKLLSLRKKEKKQKSRKKGKDREATARKAQDVFGQKTKLTKNTRQEKKKDPEWSSHAPIKQERKACKKKKGKQEDQGHTRLS